MRRDSAHAPHPAVAHSSAVEIHRPVNGIDLFGDACVSGAFGSAGREPPHPHLPRPAVETSQGPAGSRVCRLEDTHDVVCGGNFCHPSDSEMLPQRTMHDHGNNDGVFTEARSNLVVLPHVRRPVKTFR